MCIRDSFQSSVVRDTGPSISSTISQLDQMTMTSSASDSELATPWYSDQILPFDVTLSGANEYGAMCAAKIFGVEILNEGMGISIDDAVTEMQATFCLLYTSLLQQSCAQKNIMPTPVRQKLVQKPAQR